MPETEKNNTSCVLSTKPAFLKRLTRSQCKHTVNPSRRNSQESPGSLKTRSQHPGANLWPRHWSEEDWSFPKSAVSFPASPSPVSDHFLAHGYLVAQLWGMVGDIFCGLKQNPPKLIPLRLINGDNQIHLGHVLSTPKKSRSAPSVHPKGQPKGVSLLLKQSVAATKGMRELL